MMRERVDAPNTICHFWGLEYKAGLSENYAPRTEVDLWFYFVPVWSFVNCILICGIVCSSILICAFIWVWGCFKGNVWTNKINLWLLFIVLVNSQFVNTLCRTLHGVDRCIQLFYVLQCEVSSASSLSSTFASALVDATYVNCSMHFI